jgi:hypothetical protein
MRSIKAEQRAISLDMPVLDEDGAEHTLGDLLPDQMSPSDVGIGLKVDITRFLAHLAAEQIDCCGILLADSMTEGAREAGISRSTAYERSARLRQQPGSGTPRLSASRDHPERLVLTRCSRRPPC